MWMKKNIPLLLAVMALSLSACSSKGISEEQVAQLNDYAICDYNLMGVGDWGYLASYTEELDEPYYYIHYIKHIYYGIEGKYDSPFVFTYAKDIGFYGIDDWYVKKTPSAPNPIMDWGISLVELYAISSVSNEKNSKDRMTSFKDHYLYQKSGEIVASISNADKISPLHRQIQEGYAWDETASNEEFSAQDPPVITWSEKEYYVMMHFQESDSLVWCARAVLSDDEMWLCISIGLPNADDPCTHRFINPIIVSNPFRLAD